MKLAIAVAFVSASAVADAPRIRVECNNDIPARIHVAPTTRGYTIDIGWLIQRCIELRDQTRGPFDQSAPGPDLRGA